jgi:hypothetical protein
MKRQKAKVHDRRRNQKRWKRSVARRHAARHHEPRPQDAPIDLSIPPRPKLSATILAYAEPLLNDADNEHDMRAGINAAISFWNLSTLEEQEARETLVSQMDESPVEGSAERTRLLEMFDWMYRRKQDLFAHDSRLVTGHEFSKTGAGSYHLNVLGVFTEPGPNPPIAATP